MTQNLEALFGPAGRGEYAVGDTITFREDGIRYTGEIIYVAAPGQTVTGRPMPTSYQVDCEDGIPHVVYQSQVVEG